MNDNHDLRQSPEANEAVQAVVDRVLSYHGGSPADTVRGELRAGLDEVQEEMPEAWLDDTSERISNADPAQRDD